MYTKEKFFEWLAEDEDLVRAYSECMASDRNGENIAWLAWIIATAIKNRSREA